MNDHRSYSQSDKKKHSGFNGIRSHDLWYTGVLLYQLSYQTNRELGEGASSETQGQLVGAEKV